MSTSRNDGDKTNFIIFMKDFVIRKEFTLTYWKNGFGQDFQLQEGRANRHARPHLELLISQINMCCQWMPSR